MRSVFFAPLVAAAFLYAPALSSGSIAPAAALAQGKSGKADAAMEHRGKAPEKARAKKAAGQEKAADARERAAEAKEDGLAKARDAGGRGPR